MNVRTQECQKCAYSTLPAAVAELERERDYYRDKVECADAVVGEGGILEP